MSKAAVKDLAASLHFLHGFLNFVQEITGNLLNHVIGKFSAASSVIALAIGIHVTNSLLQIRTRYVS